MTTTHHKEQSPNSALIPGTVLQDRYRIVRQLGRGGMGAVYEAEDLRLGITVALKETLSADASIRKQFAQEARLLASMQHPALPRVSDHFLEGKRAFLVMQFISGVDLARIIAQQPGPFPRDQVIVWADQLLDALIYLHSRDRQVIHRDIKPHNLKLTANGQIALLDFGLAKAQPADPSATASAAFFGYTRQYAPLEQIQDRRTDPRSDIYALGATLYHLLTGTKPPDALVRAAAVVRGEKDPLRPANVVQHSVGREVAAILNKAMAQNPEDRYATAKDFREALRRVGRTRNAEAANPPGESVVPSEVAELKMAMVESGRRFGPGAVTMLILLALVVTVGTLYGSRSWSNAAKESKGQSLDTVATPRSTRKPERVRPEVISAPVGNIPSGQPEDAKKREKSYEAKRNSAPAMIGKQRPFKSTTARPRVNVPDVYLPSPSLQVVPVTNEKARSLSSGPAPKFYRNADGSQTIQFADGSTRLVYFTPGVRGR